MHPHQSNIVEATYATHTLTEIENSPNAFGKNDIVARIAIFNKLQPAATSNSISKLICLNS